MAECQSKCFIDGFWRASTRSGKMSFPDAPMLLAKCFEHKETTGICSAVERLSVEYFPVKSGIRFLSDFG